MSTEHTLTEIRAALDVEREIMGPRGGVVPVALIAQRASFYPSNDDRTRVEIADFLADVPEHYFAYKSGHSVFNGGAPSIGDTLTTWTGKEIARVTSRGLVHRSNFGDRRQSFRAVAINGATYSGVAYLDAGDYVRMRKVKPDKYETERAEAYAREHSN